MASELHYHPVCLVKSLKKGLFWPPTLLIAQLSDKTLQILAGFNVRTQAVFCEKSYCSDNAMM